MRVVRAALMQDQVAAFRGVLPCAYMSSTLSDAERASIMHDLDSATPALRLLFVTPELLDTHSFKVYARWVQFCEPSPKFLPGLSRTENTECC